MHLEILGYCSSFHFFFYFQFRFQFLHIFYSFLCILFSNAHMWCNVFLLSHWFFGEQKNKGNYVIVLLFLRHFHKEASQIKHSAILLVPLNILTTSLFFQQSLRKIPVNRTPCLPFSPHQPEFFPLSTQNPLNLIFLDYPFPKFSFPWKFFVDTETCSWESIVVDHVPGAEPPNGLQGSTVKVYSFVIVGLSSCSVFFCFDLIALVLKNLTLWVVMHVDSKLNPLLGMFW